MPWFQRDWDFPVGTQVRRYTQETLMPWFQRDWDRLFRDALQAYMETLMPWFQRDWDIYLVHNSYTPPRNTNALISKGLRRIGSIESPTLLGNTNALISKGLRLKNSPDSSVILRNTNALISKGLIFRSASVNLHLARGYLHWSESLQ